MNAKTAIALILLPLLTVLAQEPISTPLPPTPPPPAPVDPQNGAATAPVGQGGSAEATPDPGPSSINSVTRPGGVDESIVPDGSFLVNKTLNDWFMILAGKAGYSYYDNSAITDITIQGRNLGNNPLQQMKEICLMYGLTLYTKGDTIYALTSEQVASLPKKEFIYQLQYLRGTSEADATQLTELIKPSLSGGGSVFFEPKTYTLVIRDNDYAIESIQNMLEVLDRPKGQVAITVRILRLNGNASKGFGIDWSQTLGSESGQGLTVGASVNGNVSRILSNAPVFGEAVAALQTITGSQATPTVQNGTDAGTTSDAGTAVTPTSSVTGDGIVISPLAVEVVLRALSQNNYATSERTPRLVTEDNEEVEFGVQDSIPIIEQSVNDSVGGGNPTVATTARYDINPNEPADAALKTKVGFSITARPTIMPDGTIRLAINPQIGVITGYEEAPTGFPGIVNRFPIVNVAGYKNSHRVPNGYTIVSTGYYTIEDQLSESKVPLLGDLPIAGNAFRSKVTRRMRSDLVFLITVKTYDAASQIQTVEEKERLMQRSFERADAQVPDPDYPEESTKPNLGQAIRNLWPFGKEKAEPINPLDDDSSERRNRPQIVTSQEVEERQMEEVIVRRAQPVSRSNRN